jgi:hypothetical protein
MPENPKQNPNPNDPPEGFVDVYVVDFHARLSEAFADTIQRLLTDIMKAFDVHERDWSISVEFYGTFEEKKRTE